VPEMGLRSDPAQDARLRPDLAQDARLRRDPAQDARLRRDPAQDARLRRDPAHDVRLRRDPAQDARLRRDPAPTRWSYRYQRLMLTPMFRAVVRIGLPVLIIVFVATAWFTNPANQAYLAAQIEAAKAAVQQRPEFMVTEMVIEGADEHLTAAILNQLEVELPVSSFDLDLAGLRDTVSLFGAVESVVVRVRGGGTLAVEVTQRVPVAVWRYEDELRLIDAGGVMTGRIQLRADMAELPLIAGDGAGAAIDEALALFAGAGPLRDRVQGLVRMGERRWDLVLDRGQRILLPPDDPIAALDRVIALHEAQDMLERDVAVVDMRNAARPTIRLNAPAVAVMRRTNEALAAGQ